MVKGEKKNLEVKSINRIKVLIPYLGLILVFVVFMILSEGRLLSPRNIKPLVNMCFPVLIGSSCIMFIIAQGNIDLSIGAVMAFSGILGAMAANVNIYLLLPVTLLVGLAIGYLNSIFAVRLRINSFLSTLSMSFVLLGASSFILNSSGLGVSYELLNWSSQGLRLGAMISVYIVCAFVLGWTKFGRQCKTIGSNETAAFYSGINIKRLKSIAFVICGGAAGLLAFFSIIRTGTANSTMGGQLAFDALIALLIGGFPISGGANSNIRAPLVGSITITIIMNGMTLIGIGEPEQLFTRGAILLLIVALTFDRKSVPIIK